MPASERCAGCGRMFPLDQLDAKPRSLRSRKATNAMLSHAAERGEDFDVLQCRACFGPAWLPLKGAPHAR